MPTLQVMRQDNGMATFILRGPEIQGGQDVTWSGFWDDATPWQTGTYTDNTFKPPSWNTNLLGIYVNGGTSSGLVPPGREGILIHTGSSQNASEGCLILAEQNIRSMLDLIKNGRAISDNAAAQELDIQVFDAPGPSLDYDFRVRSTVSQVKEGEQFTLTLSIDGAGGNGISKDAYLYLDFTGDAVFGKDFKISDTDQKKLLSADGFNGTWAHGFTAPPRAGVPQWVEIKAGQTSLDLKFDVIADADDGEIDENISVRITDYFIGRVKNGSEIFYRDKLKNQLDPGNDAIVTIGDQESFTKLFESDGQGTWDYKIKTAPNQKIQVTFDAYSIPDTMTVRDLSTSTLYFNEWHGNSLPPVVKTFTVDANSTGDVAIRVAAPLSGTAWEFLLESLGISRPGSDPAQMPFSASLDAAIVAAFAPALAAEAPLSDLVTTLVSQDSLLRLRVQEGWVEEFEPDTVRPLIILESTGSTEHSVRWSIDFSFPNSVSVADLIAGSATSGVVQIAPNSREFIDLYLAEDGVAEIDENISFLFFDADTNQPILAADGTPLRVTLAAIDGLSLRPTNSSAFSDGGDTITGISGMDLQNGGNGDDLIDGAGGNDWLSGDNGDDTLIGGDGADTLDPGFGNDSIDGGTGLDVLKFLRARADVLIERNPDGSYLVEDTGSWLPLGSKTVRNVETIELSDGDVFLGVQGTAASDTLAGSADGEAIRGLGGDDLLEGLEGDDFLDGGEGYDIARFAVSASDLSIRTTPEIGTFIVTSSLGNDTITGIEALSTADGNVDIGISASGLFRVARGGDNFMLTGTAYVGPVTYLERQLLGSGNTEVLAGTIRNDFFNLLGGDDAANAGNGNDVLDGGTGSNFLTGGTGNDVFFLDGRGGTITWSTITDWGPGEQLSVWGWKPGISKATWIDKAGAAGFEGITMHGDLDADGTIDTSVTWSGMTRAALPTPVEQADLLWFIA